MCVWVWRFLFSLINGLCEAVFCDQSGRDSLHVSKTLFCNSLRVVCILEQWFKTTHLHMEERFSGNDHPPQKVPPSHSHFLRPHAMTARHVHVCLPNAACACGNSSLDWAVLPDLSRKQVIGLTEQSHNKHLALQKGISVFAYTSYEFLNIIVLIYSTNCIFLQQNIY